MDLGYNILKITYREKQSEFSFQNRSKYSCSACPRVAVISIGISKQMASINVEYPLLEINFLLERK
jgi:hypothetical protein